MRRLVFALFLLASPALAVQPDEILADPALEARARDISKDLRCLVCRNESIDDSSASLARDLRLLVRERMLAGDTDTEAVDYIVDRYGEFVLLNPRVSGANLIIWLAGPALLLIGGAARRTDRGGAGAAGGTDAGLSVGRPSRNRTQGAVGESVHFSTESPALLTPTIRPAPIWRRSVPFRSGVNGPPSGAGNPPLGRLSPIRFACAVGWRNRLPGQLLWPPDCEV